MLVDFLHLLPIGIIAYAEIFFNMLDTKIILIWYQSSLNTIHFYIILKLYITNKKALLRLNTIHFYIILKLSSNHKRLILV